MNNQTRGRRAPDLDPTVWNSQRVPLVTLLLRQKIQRVSVYRESLVKQHRRNAEASKPCIIKPPSATNDMATTSSVSINQVKKNLDPLLYLVGWTSLLDLVYSVREACFVWLVEVTRLFSWFHSLSASGGRSMLTYRFKAGAFGIQSLLQCPN